MSLSSSSIASDNWVEVPEKVFCISEDDIEVCESECLLCTCVSGSMLVLPILD